MSEAGDPPEDSDWFRGRTASRSAANAPRPVGEAFGHLRRTDEEPAGESDWFDAGDEQAAGEEGSGTLVEMRAAAGGSGVPAPAEPSEVPVASAPAVAEPDSGAAAPSDFDPVAPADAASEPSSEATSEAVSEAVSEADDGRVRLRALTGGLADLSDALAAIGVESVALRSPGAARPTPPPAPPEPSEPSAADFRVRCPDCGPQYVAVSDLRFVETGDGAEANRYLFTCPACGARVRRPAGPELAAILKSSGVATLALRRGPGQAL